MLKQIFILIFCLFSLAGFGQQFSRWQSEEGLYLEFYKGSKLVSSSSGFVIKTATQNYLVTNYHAVTSKSWVQKKPLTKQYHDKGAVYTLLNGYWSSAKKSTSPDRVAIYHNAKDSGRHLVKYENLVGKKGQNLWHGYKLKNGYADAVALPLKDTTDVEFYPVDYTNSTTFSMRHPVGLIVYPSDSKPGVTDVVNNDNKIYQSESQYDAMSGSPVYEIIDNEPKFVGVFAHSATVRTNIVYAKLLEKIIGKLPK